MTLLPEHESELLTVEEFARLLKVSRTTVFSWLNTGIIQEGVHYIRLGRILRFRWVADLFFSNKRKGNSKPQSKIRPTAQKRHNHPSESGVNLDYGVLTL